MGQTHEDENEDDAMDRAFIEWADEQETKPSPRRAFEAGWAAGREYSGEDYEIEEEESDGG